MAFRLFFSIYVHHQTEHILKERFFMNRYDQNSGPFRFFLEKQLISRLRLSEIGQENYEKSCDNFHFRRRKKNSK